jgi:hypothetical protein
MPCRGFSRVLYIIHSVKENIPPKRNLIGMQYLSLAYKWMSYLLLEGFNNFFGFTIISYYAITLNLDETFSK